MSGPKPKVCLFFLLLPNLNSSNCLRLAIRQKVPQYVECGAGQWGQVSFQDFSACSFVATMMDLFLYIGFSVV